MLKLRISARFSTGMKLSSKANADVGERREQENSFESARELCMSLRERERNKEKDKISERGRKG